MVYEKQEVTVSDAHLIGLNRMLAAAGIARVSRSFYVFCGIEHSTGDTVNPPSALRFGRILEFIDRHTDENLDLQRLAAEANLSPYHFARIFRDETGKPPLTYVREVRVEKARRMLEDGSPVSQVAYATGFSDQSHLTREFKKKTGQTPGRYRRNRRTGNSKDIQESNR